MNSQSYSSFIRIDNDDPLRPPLNPIAKQIVHTEPSLPQYPVATSLSNLKCPKPYPITMADIATYEEVKDLVNHPEKVLIDVREPKQRQETGEIPTSINIPSE